MTLGLSKRWQKLFNHIDQNDVMSGLILLIKVMRLDEPPLNGIGSVTEALSIPLANALLFKWGEKDEFCRKVHCFVNFLESENNLKNKYASLPPSETEAKIFGDKKASLYLLRMCVQEISSTDTQLCQWFNILRVWVLTHAANRAKNGIYLEKNIKTVANALTRYIQSNTIGPQVSRVFKGLDFESNLHSFDYLNEWISHRARWLSKEPFFPQDNYQKSIVNALLQISTEESESPVLKSIETKDNIPVSLLKDLYPEPRDDLSISSDPSISDEDWLPTIPQYGDSDDGGSSFTESVPASSYAYQKLAAKTVWLLHTELLHLLPWTWNQLIPAELEGLEQWITHKLQSKDFKLALLAACCWLAIHTGRSLRRVLDFRIHAEPQKEWTLIVDTLCLRRLPPIRSQSWETKPENDSWNWVRPYAEFNELVITDQIKKVLEAVIANTGMEHCSYLGDYWYKLTAIENIEVPFNQQMTGPLNRVKSGMLGNILVRRVFQKDGDPNLARMSAFHPQIGLPGTFAYGNWDLEQVNRLMTPPEVKTSKTTQLANVIGFGSKMDVVESMLIDSIREAGLKVDMLRKGDDPLAFHNAFIAYLTVALWAATGARPASDSFESPLHFDHELQFVYVNDKSDSVTHDGRICPLVTSLNEIVRDILPLHLQLLSEALSDIHPELSHEIALLSNRQPSGKMPYLFILNEKTLSWKSVCAESIAETTLFSWPLPMRLFRQRFIKQAIREKIDQEVIDGWMGHVESGNATYSDFSIRCWRDDWQKYQDKLEIIFDRLKFNAFTTWSKPPTIKAKNIKELPDIEFGIKARETARKKGHDDAVQEANMHIDQFLAGRSLDELHKDDLKNNDPKKDKHKDELEQLTTFLTCRDKGLPRTYAALRYQQLSKRIDTLREDQGKKLHIIKRFQYFGEDKHGIRHNAAVAYSLFTRLALAWKSELDTLNVKQSGKNDCRLYAILSLVLENRIVYAGMLKDIYSGNHFRMVSYKRRFYQEYAEHLDPKELDAPVQRHRISPKTAHLLDHAFSTKRKVDFGCEEFPARLQNFHTLFSTHWPEPINTHSAFITQLCRLVNQANLIDFPGTVSAFLSGRVLSCSLRWRDWIRLDCQRILMVPCEVPDDEQESLAEVEKLLESPRIRFRSSIMTIDDEKILQDNANTFIREVRKALNAYTKADRLKTVSEIKSLRQQYNGNVSSTLLLLAKWIAQRINSGIRKTKKSFANSSPGRYFAALSSEFEQLAYRIDIMVADEEEVTRLYADFLEASSDKEGTFHADRLMEFHQFLRDQGVEDPDWSELDLPVKTRRVSPGIITEKDYQSSLQLLLHQTKYLDKQNCRMAFFLLICFRFGTRSSEALGLRHDDWRDLGGTRHILVRDHKRYNHILKNKPSRRIVPLLFTLSATEQHIINTFMAYALDSQSDKPEAALFATDENSPNEVKGVDLIKRVVSLTLKQVTGNPRIVIHHCRHSFANATALPLYHLNIKSWDRLNGRAADKDFIRETTLGTQCGISRRNTMAAARLLGHGHPRTEAVSYQHFVGDWADQLAGVSDKPSKQKLKNVVYLDKYKMKSVVDTRVLQKQEIKYTRPTTDALLKLLALVSRGKPFYAAGHALWLKPEITDMVEKTVRTIGARIRLSTKDGVRPKMGESTALEFLTRINNDAWNRMLGHTKLFNAKNKLLSFKPMHPEKLSEIVGVTKQLTLWKPQHFMQLSTMLEQLKIPNNYYHACLAHENDKIRSIANECGLQLSSLEKARTENNPLTPDSIRSADYVSEHKKDYCVLVFSRNDNFCARNSLEFLALFLAYSCSLFHIYTDE